MDCETGAVELRKVLIWRCPSHKFVFVALTWPSLMPTPFRQQWQKIGIDGGHDVNKCSTAQPHRNARHDVGQMLDFVGLCWTEFMNSPTLLDTCWTVLDSLPTQSNIFQQVSNTIQHCPTSRELVLDCVGWLLDSCWTMVGMCWIMLDNCPTQSNTCPTLLDGLHRLSNKFQQNPTFLQHMARALESFHRNTAYRCGGSSNNRPTSRSLERPVASTPAHRPSFLPNARSNGLPIDRPPDRPVGVPTARSTDRPTPDRPTDPLTDRSAVHPLIFLPGMGCCGMFRCCTSCKFWLQLSFERGEAQR